MAAFLIVANIALLAVVVSLIASSWHVSELKRRQAEQTAAVNGQLQQLVQDLRQSEARQAAMLNSALDAVVTMDHNGEIVEFNPAAERMFGYRRDDVLGKRVADLLVPPSLQEAHQAGFARFLESGEGPILGKRLELPARRADGSEFPAEIAVNQVEGQSPPLFTGFIRDISERKRSSAQFRLAIEASPTGMIMVDPAGKIVLVNSQIERLFGFRRDELIGQTIEILVPERFRVKHPGFRREFASEPRFRPMGAGRDLYGLRKDGSEFPVEIGLNPIRTPDGFFVLSSVVDISERKRAEREREQLMSQLKSLNAELEERVRGRTSELMASVKEREVLLQEVHHRVKNNLQIISSLINMQMRPLDEPAGREALEECQSRVQAIALIHEKLHHTREYTRVPFSEYARSLASNIFDTSGTSPSRIALQMEIENISVPVDRAIPCGLILNELITNALKHAFPAERSGVVRVELRKTDTHELLLVVGDDGVGMMADFDPDTSSSLGMQLVSTLVEQLDGRLEIVRNCGTTFRIEFPAEAA
jgi:PAS domain S-box-containing protein